MCGCLASVCLRVKNHFLRCVFASSDAERELRRLKPVRRHRRRRFLLLRPSGLLVHIVGAAGHRAEQNDVGF